MAQFSVHRNADPRSCAAIPYLLDVQCPLLEALATRVVVPLLRVGADSVEIERLTPRFRVDGEDLLMSTPEIAGVPAAVLGEQVDSLTEERDRIVAALDFLFTGV